MLVKAACRHVRDNAAMSIQELSPAQARERLAHGAVLIDVREAHERAGGMAEGARGVAKGELQADPAAHLPRHDQEILLICQSGKRSADAAQFLLEAGYTRVASVTGGTVAWREQSLPLVQPLASAADRDFYDRYSRHLLLPQVGEAGQRRLQQSRVLVLGAGGLGAPAGGGRVPPGRHRGLQAAARGRRHGPPAATAPAVRLAGAGGRRAVAGR